MQNVTTKLHKAAINGELGIILNLISKGIDPKSLDSAGRKPIYYAYQKGHVEIVRILLDCTELTVAEDNELRKMAFDLSKDKTSKDPFYAVYELLTNLYLYDPIWENYSSHAERVRALFKDYYAPQMLNKII